MTLHLRPWLSGLTIKTKGLDMRRLDLDRIDPTPQGELGDFGWAQRPFIDAVEREYNAGRPLRFVVLKARQVGISTATEALLFLWAFLYRGSNSLVISYEDPQAQELFQMMKTYWDNWPHRSLYTLQYSTKRQLRWLETKSQVRVATAKNVGGARGSTVHALHASEVAFWADPETLWVGLNQTIPSRHGTLVVLESTANGIGNWFHEQWTQADNQESEFIPLFFPYYRHYEYRMATTLSTRSELNADERNLLRLMLTEGADNDTCYRTIAWRRWAIINKCNGDLPYFMQEYPATPDEAFIATGRPIFPAQRVRDAYTRRTGAVGRLFRNAVGRVVFEPDPSGPLTIYVRPNHSDDREDRYFIGGDPSETVAGDPGCMQVLNRQSYEIVAVWHDRVNPIYFAEQMILLGDFYNHCTICPEVEGGGQACIGYITKSAYGNVWRDKRPDRIRAGNVFGWSTNQTRKQWAIGILQKRILDGSLSFHDPKTYNQLISFVEHDDGYWGNSNPKIHDDAVMALAITLTASEEHGPFQQHAAQLSNPLLDLYRQEHDYIPDDPDDPNYSAYYSSTA
jgi:hypothetical protein